MVSRCNHCSIHPGLHSVYYQYPTYSKTLYRASWACKECLQGHSWGPTASWACSTGTPRRYGPNTSYYGCNRTRAMTIHRTPLDVHQRDGKDMYAPT